MDEHEWLAERFEANRAHLRAVAYRMLGSTTEADDAVQESWLRLSRSDTSDVENLGGWLTTVGARVPRHAALAPVTARGADRRARARADCGPVSTATDPEHEALLADSVGLALLVVLETLAPAERIAFVLHDMFAVPFDEIAGDRRPLARRGASARQPRATSGARVSSSPGDVARQREVVDAFLAASRDGDFDALLALLDPDVVLRADPGAVPPGGSAEVHGAPAVAEQFSGRARAAQPALIDGAVGLVWAPGGRPQVVFDLTIMEGKIVEIDLIADADRLGELDVATLDA